MSTLSTTKMTARQFLQLGEDPPGIRLELVNGEIEVSPSPLPNHSYTEKALSAFIFMYIRANDLGSLYGDVDTILTDLDVRRPDIIYFSKERLHLKGKKAMEGPPDMVAEIVSPSSIVIDRKRKFAQYESFGIPNYWIIDPAQLTFEAFSLIDGKYHAVATARNSETISAPPFPNLKISLDDLWDKSL